MLADTEQFDLAILDIRMPTMSGIELGKLLHNSHGIHSIFLTAYSDEPTVRTATGEGGALSYLLKPIAASQMVPVIESALARVKEIHGLEKKRDNLERALASKRAISIAIGIIMERRKLTDADAFEVLRQEARSRNGKLEDIAQGIVAASELLNGIGHR